MQTKLRVVAIQKLTNRPHLKIPEALVCVEAGFPSPADDYVEKERDLHELMVCRPAATFFVRVSGDSMKGAGIASGDLLVVDRSEEPKPNKIVVAIVDGEFTVKRLVKQGVEPPVFGSANLDTGDEHNARLLAENAHRIHYMD